jgi:chaperone BCS1
VSYTLFREQEPLNQDFTYPSFFSIMTSVLHSFTSSLRTIPTASSWFEAYVALSTSLMLLQTATSQFIPVNVRSYIFERLKSYFFGTVAGISCHVTLTIHESWENMGRNELYDAVNEYLPSKISRANKNLKVGKFGGGNKIAMAIEGGESIVDVFDDVKLTWRYSHQKDRQQQEDPTHFSSRPAQSDHSRPMYVLSFDENDREKVMDSYLPHILDKYKAMKEGEKVLKHYTRTSGSWQSSVLEHPATFDTLAMEPELKKAILNDLDRFLRRKSFYKKVGKAWKRGYLLYGPPGTGKTSLIAAMANYLKFDVYDLELSGVHSNADLMRSLRNTSNRSILVVEDIDCNRVVRDRAEKVRDHPIHPFDDPTFRKVSVYARKSRKHRSKFIHFGEQDPNRLILYTLSNIVTHYILFNMFTWATLINHLIFFGKSAYAFFKLPTYVCLKLLIVLISHLKLIKR